MSSNQSMESENDRENCLKEEEIDPCPVQIGYKLSLWRSLLFYPVAVFPACLGLLIAYWFPHVWIRLTCYRCMDLQSADFIIVKDLDCNWKVEVVSKFIVNNSRSLSSDDEEIDDTCSSETRPLVTPVRTVQYITHRYLRYIYSSERNRFVVLRGYERGVSCVSLHNMIRGITAQQYQERLTRYGRNEVDVPVKPYHVLLIEEVLHPFYIFQILSVIFWMLDEYYYYSVAVLLIFIISILLSLIQTRRHMQQLHDMAATNGQVTVLRNGQVLSDISSDQLVPGDVMVIPREGMAMTCDVVLLTGNAIVNESMLTGESVPVTKTALPVEDKLYTPETHKSHTLFAGTQVVQARYYSQQLVLAVVIRTGFLTAKGGMIRSILFPKPLNIRFYWDSIKFILLLSLLAGCGFIYTILILQLHKPPYEIKETIFRALDIITTIVPPSLPAAITVGTVYAVNRLRKSQIYCISPQRVNLCGKVKLVCFDKTGTLTDDSMDLLGVQPVIANKFSGIVKETIPDSPLLYGMASCHSLTYINGQLTGDPLDMKMFQATDWVLEEPGDDSTRFDTLRSPVVRPRAGTPTDTPTDTSLCLQVPSIQVGCNNEENDIELGILKLYTFSSELQRMSVLVRKLPADSSRDLLVYVKGAPEMIRSLSRPESVPNDFSESLGSLTRAGFRVLAMGYRQLHTDFHHAMKLERDEVECDLIFCGLIVFENKLKPQTPPTLRLLKSASIRTVMITGDNLLTAIAVSRNSGMIADTHSVIILTAATPTINGSLPSLSYRIFKNDDVKLSFSDSHSSNRLGSPLVASGGKFSIQMESCECNGHQTLLCDQYFHLAVDGHTFSLIRQHYLKRDIYERLLVSGTVFARMSPIQKKQLVSDLMSLGYGVAMCGDGANDCGALKAAHVGISLSESEASVASPFTSKIPNITCVPVAIREGRAALVTSFSVFKFMALYSLTEFSSAAILYAIESNLGDIQYLYIDLVLILSFAFVIGLTGPYPYLVKRRPLGTLAGVQVFTSIIVQAVLMLTGQLGMYFYLKSQGWFIPLIPGANDDNILCWENTVVFTTSIFQYIALAIAFSTAAPYRRPLFTNIWFMICLAVLLPANLYIALAPAEWLPWFWSFFQLIPPTSFLFKATLVMAASIHFLLAYLIEGYLFPSQFMLKLFRLVRCKSKPKNHYKRILYTIQNDTSWPPPLPHAMSAAPPTHGLSY